MGFFKDFREDLSNNVSDKNKNMELEKAQSEDKKFMVNTLDDDAIAKMSASIEKASLDKEAFILETEEKNVEQAPVENEILEDDGIRIYNETAVITKELTVSGDINSKGSIDSYGVIGGNVTCRGKLTISGTINGDSQANEIFANDAEINGNVIAKGSIKIGQGTVVIGNVSGASAVIAGAIKGDIDVKGPVIIDASAVIVGDIKSKSVQINNGATIEGRCSQCYAELNPNSLFEKKTEI